MRAHKIINYQSVLQLLGDKGCPFCAFLKNYQAALLQEPAKKEVQHLCNFHTWGLAATQNPITAAELFLTFLSRPFEPAATSCCDLCILLRLEEDRRLREFISSLDHRLVVAWLRARGVVCLVHGLRLKAGTPPATAALIDRVMRRQRDTLATELAELLEKRDPNPEKWGTLGRAAEYVAAQRGLHL